MLKLTFSMLTTVGVAVMSEVCDGHCRVSSRSIYYNVCRAVIRRRTGDSIAGNVNDGVSALDVSRCRWQPQRHTEPATHPAAPVSQQ